MASQPHDVLFDEPSDAGVIEQELYCWIPGSADRMCGPDCVAFDPRFKDDSRVTSCSVLNSVKSVALSVAKISAPLVQMSKRQESENLSAKIKEVTVEPPRVK
jgi:hypothetical protein